MLDTNVDDLMPPNDLPLDGVLASVARSAGCDGDAGDGSMSNGDRQLIARQTNE